VPLHRSFTRGRYSKLSNNLDDLIEIGKITSSSGVKGRLKVYSYIQSHDFLRSLDAVMIEHPNKQLIRYSISRLRIKSPLFYLDCDGVDAALAEKLSGCSIFALSDNLEPLEDGEYYWNDLIGLTVLTDDGRRIGIIDHIIPTGSNDVFVCTGGDREVLIPAVTDVVTSIDLDAGVMIVSLINGLEDL